LTDKKKRGKQLSRSILIWGKGTRRGGRARLSFCEGKFSPVRTSPNSWEEGTLQGKGRGGNRSAPALDGRKRRRESSDEEGLSQQHHLRGGSDAFLISLEREKRRGERGRRPGTFIRSGDGFGAGEGKKVYLKKKGQPRPVRAREKENLRLYPKKGGRKGSRGVHEKQRKGRGGGASVAGDSLYRGKEKKGSPRSGERRMSCKRYYALRGGKKGSGRCSFRRGEREGGTSREKGREPISCLREKRADACRTRGERHGLGKKRRPSPRGKDVSYSLPGRGRGKSVHPLGQKGEKEQASNCPEKKASSDVQKKGEMTGAVRSRKKKRTPVRKRAGRQKARVRSRMNGPEIAEEGEEKRGTEKRAVGTGTGS